MLSIFFILSKVSFYIPYFIKSDQPNQNGKIHLSLPHYKGNSLGIFINAQIANKKKTKVNNSGSERHFEKKILKDIK